MLGLILIIALVVVCVVIWRRRRHRTNDDPHPNLEMKDKSKTNSYISAYNSGENLNKLCMDIIIIIMLLCCRLNVCNIVPSVYDAKKNGCTIEKNKLMLSLILGKTNVQIGGLFGGKAERRVGDWRSQQH